MTDAQTKVEAITVDVDQQTYGAALRLLMESSDYKVFIIMAENAERVPRVLSLLENSTKMQGFDGKLVERDNKHNRQLTFVDHDGDESFISFANVDRHAAHGTRLQFAVPLEAYERAMTDPVKSLREYTLDGDLLKEVERVFDEMSILCEKNNIPLFMTICTGLTVDEDGDVCGERLMKSKHNFVHDGRESPTVEIVNKAAHQFHTRRGEGGIAEMIAAAIAGRH